MRMLSRNNTEPLFGLWTFRRLVAPTVTCHGDLLYMTNGLALTFTSQNTKGRWRAPTLVFPPGTRAMEIDGCGTTMRPIDGSFGIEACPRGM